MLDENKRWFPEARYGLFIHWGPYAQYGRGEQVLFREHLDQADYEARARSWNPEFFDAKAWAKVAADGGFKYAVLTTRHHDSYALWDTKYSNYNSMQCAPKCDLVREYVEAFREAGLRVGLYYSWADWTSKAYWSNPDDDLDAWNKLRDMTHNQVEELLTNYGKIDVFWFDGTWPHPAARWDSSGLVKRMRELQPDILINNRLDAESPFTAAQGAVEFAGESKTMGDFGTPEHHITADNDRIWESCQTSTWRLWGYARGEHWRPAGLMLDYLCQASSQGGNLLLNVGPQPDGRIPAEFIDRSAKIGEWLKVHGEAIYGTTRGDITEFTTKGWQTLRGNSLYLIYRFWHGEECERIAELATPAKAATLLSTGQSLKVENRDDAIYIKGMPRVKPSSLFPVIRLDFGEPPKAKEWAKGRLWNLDPRLMQPWVNEIKSD
ncbi:alpha-L-fucosidase [Rubellicoccus peritrichatus]|uniref:alpha-L-fucosidase n=1 Tax=Rubellicoccus peritrichatus TaxID=3080537 RepID=A0AAQ3L993_9BACT|nr:alpha-L-fucosidase [Puniceicoccus sp. CR14]WOO40057.1 alpha-L-fucosidase [Puniceicoccus sp. CR14]